MNQVEAEMLTSAILALENLREDYVKEAIEVINALCPEEAGQELPLGLFSLEDSMTPHPHSQGSLATNDGSKEDAISCLHQGSDDFHHQESEVNPDVVEKIGSGCADNGNLCEFGALEKEVHEKWRNPGIEDKRSTVRETVAECRSVIAHWLADALNFATKKKKKGEDSGKHFESFKALLKWITKGKKKGFLRTVGVALKAAERREEMSGRKQESTGHREETKSKKTGGEPSLRDTMKGQKPVDEVFDRLLLAIQLVSYLGNDQLINIRRRVLRGADGQRLKDFIKKCVWELHVIGSLILHLNVE